MLRQYKTPNFWGVKARSADVRYSAPQRADIRVGSSGFYSARENETTGTIGPLGIDDPTQYKEIRRFALIIWEGPGAIQALESRELNMRSFRWIVICDMVGDVSTLVAATVPHVYLRDRTIKAHARVWPSLRSTARGRGRLWPKYLL